MPIFEYVCKGCGKPFEAIVRGSEKLRCPHCNSVRLEQQLSVFAVAAGRGDGGADLGDHAAPSCGRCGVPGGSCALDDD